MATPTPTLIPTPTPTPTPNPAAATYKKDAENEQKERPALLAHSLQPLWGDPGQPWAQGRAGPATRTRPPIEPQPPHGGQRSPVPGDLWPLPSGIPLGGIPEGRGLTLRRALQRNTKLRRAPGALYARHLLRALGAQEGSRARAPPLSPCAKRRAPGHAHLREHALGMRPATRPYTQSQAADPQATLACTSMPLGCARPGRST